jgi:hypothetical protein
MLIKCGLVNLSDMERSKEERCMLSLLGEKLEEEAEDVKNRKNKERRRLERNQKIKRSLASAS